jgi:hypothetical protein
LEKEFAPILQQKIWSTLGFVQVYMKLMIDGVTSQPFSATTLPPIEKPLVSFKEDIIKYSRATFARPRAAVEEAIKKWHEEGRLPDPRRRDTLPRGKEPSQHREREVRGPKEKDTSPEDMKNKLHEALRDAQERELRSAITANYTKNKVERQEDEKRKQQQQKKDKGPKPENLGALREALASVLQGVEVKPQALKTEPKPQTSPAFQAPPSKGEPQSPRPEPKPEPRVEKKPPVMSEEPKEVPEDVLRRILELDR